LGVWKFAGFLVKLKDLMKQLIATTAIILVTAGILGGIILGSQKGKNQSQIATSVTPTPIQSGVDENEIIFYYSQNCPHCIETEEWMQNNQAEEKLKIVKKEVTADQASALELIAAAEKCGLNTNSVGVPFLLTRDKKCLVGTTDIIDYLTKEIEVENQEVKLSPTPLSISK